MYNFIYYLNKVMPRLATRLADWVFPPAPWEADHDLSDPRWADVNIDDGDFEWYESDCMACLEPERYDDHLCPERA